MSFNRDLNIPMYTYIHTYLNTCGCLSSGRDSNILEGYIYIYIYIHTHIHTYTYIHTYIHMYIYVYICLQLLEVWKRFEHSWRGSDEGLVVNVAAYVYVCMYVCTYVCMRVCMYVCMYVCLWGSSDKGLVVDVAACMHAFMYVRTYVCMYQWVHGDMVLYVCFAGKVYACLYVIFCECIYIYIYIYTHIYIYDDTLPSIELIQETPLLEEAVPEGDRSSLINNFL